MEFRVTGFRELSQWGDSRRTRQALKTSINETLTAVSRKGKDEIKSAYAVKIRIINKRSYLAKAKAQNLRGAAWYGGDRLTSNRFPVSMPGKRTAWVKIRKGRQESFPGSFAHQRGGERFLWQRSSEVRSRSGRRQGLVDPVRKRKLSVANMALEKIGVIRRFQAAEFDRYVRREFLRLAQGG